MSKYLPTLLLISVIFIAGCSQFQNNTVLFEKTTVWGPCPKNSGCHQSIKLYYSGELIMEGEKTLQKQLSQKTINEIIEKIKATGVMEKFCSVEPPQDYGATYKLNIDNKEKTFEYPGCRDQMSEIEKIIPIE